MLNFSLDFETSLEVVVADHPPTVLILDLPVPAPVPVLDQVQEVSEVLEVLILETPLEVFLEVAEGSQTMEPKNLFLLERTKLIHLIVDEILRRALENCASLMDNFVLTVSSFLLLFSDCA